MLPNAKEPLVVKAGGSSEMSIIAAIDISEDATPHLKIQAFRVLRHAPGLSWPVALAVAEIIFGRAGA
ncbi:hypothetical protein [Mesorhizobium sp. CN2-181]|uniref:hypothetical protein n=1 Tax=Mesorhizobium yinganensis TaxID=3157707 RepID=UPI0032B705EC